MKWTVFAIAVAAVYPLGLLVRRYSWAPSVLAVLIGMLPFVMPEGLSIHLITDETYRGDSRGFQVTVVDLVAVVAWVALPPAAQPVPYRRARWLYLFFATLSVAFAALPLYAAFSVWTIVRAYFLLAVVVRLCERRPGQPDRVPHLLRGLALGLVYAFVVALYQRYVLGYWRVSADFVHPNTLAMAANLVAPLALAVLLARRGGWLPFLTVVAGAVVIIMSLSRAALALFAVAVALVFVGSLLRGVSSRKVWAWATATALGVAMTAYAADTIVERFTTASVASANVRHRFNDAAAEMVSDHPMGIGINQYSHVLDEHGYGDGVGLSVWDRDGIAHHIYWLTAAEVGIPGLIAYLLLLASPLVLAIRGAWRAKGDMRGDVLLGAAAALTVFHLQGLYEWAARQPPLMYLFFIIAGVVAVLERQTRGGQGPR